MSESAWSIDARTRLVALLGYPVGHSLSPAIHNAAFAEQGLNARYLAFPVAPDRIRVAVEGLKALHVLGANVTIPHKQAVLPLMDVLTPEATAVGAVNTISVVSDTDGPFRLRGDNTDVEGFAQPLQAYRDRLQGQQAVIFGAGGAARAVAFALLTRVPCSGICVVARNLDKAQAFVADFEAYQGEIRLEAVSLTGDCATEAVAESRLLVNTTPLGMHPDTETTVWPGAAGVSADHIVYDLVYNPLETRLLREAVTQGATVIGGLDMFIGQAAAAYVQWTNRPMPLDVVRRVLRAAV